MKIILIVVSSLLLVFSILCLLYAHANKNTLIRWTNHKQLLWVSEFEKIKVIYCNGNGFIEIYKCDNFNGIQTCIDDDYYQKYKHIFKAEIKYLKGIDENGYLIIQLWNTKKLNKIYGVKNDK